MSTSAQIDYIKPRKVRTSVSQIFKEFEALDDIMMVIWILMIGRKAQIEFRGPKNWAMLCTQIPAKAASISALYIIFSAQKVSQIQMDYM